jgi:hypothetical protein
MVAFGLAVGLIPTNGREQANMKIEKGRASSGKAEQRTKKGKNGSDWRNRHRKMF